MNVCLASAREWRQPRATGVHIDESGPESSDAGPHSFLTLFAKERTSSRVLKIRAPVVVT
jgi:hypothetical protein